MPVFLLQATADTGLTTLGQTFSTVMTWLGDLVQTIQSTPLLLLATGIFAIGAVIGLAQRLIRG